MNQTHKKIRRYNKITTIDEMNYTEDFNDDHTTINEKIFPMNESSICCLIVSSKPTVLQIYFIIINILA